MNADSDVDDYNLTEMKQALASLKKQFPAVYRWFFIWELERIHGARSSDPGLDQEQKADSGSS